jgi:epoxyqueuosine reductase
MVEIFSRFKGNKTGDQGRTVMNEKVLQFLTNLFLTNELNRLPEPFGGDRIFDPPLIGVSRGDDPIFKKFKEVVAPEHLTPVEMWKASGLGEQGDPAAGLRILSIIFPFVKRIREESKKAVKMPADIYCLGRNYANEFMKEVLRRTMVFFQDRGFRATAGMLSPAFRLRLQEKPPQFYSLWSERHMAFAAGLGTFSLHEGLITEAGCNVRMTSVITDAPLMVTPRRSDDPYANCLYYAKEECRECEKRCPGKAITEEGHDKVKCRAYGVIISKAMNKKLGPLLKPHERNVEGTVMVSYPVGCAFCQFKVPCMDRNPMAKAQKGS